MTLPKLPSVADIHSRLERLFTPGLEMRKNLVREMAAKTVFVFLYGGMGYGVPDDAMGYGLPPGHFGKAVLTPRKNVPKAEHPHEPPGRPKNYWADINTLIELLESGGL